MHDPLSEVSPDNPVYLTRIDGNASFANKKALEISGITKETPDPVGGFIIRKENGIEKTIKPKLGDPVQPNDVIKVPESYF